MANTGVANVPILKRRKNDEYHEKLEKTYYWDFIHSADYHYFVSRVLFLHYVALYAQFSAYQCVENYLKAYLKYHERVPPNSHNLQELLKLCHDQERSGESFITSDNLSIIITKYEPFYELPRYPAQKQLPEKGYSFLIPDDIYILDYFVMRMRQILPVPTNASDIFRATHFELHLCQQNCPNFYSTFLANNINFVEKSH